MMGFYSNQTFDKTWFIDDKTWRCNSSNVGIQPNEKKTSSNTKDLEKFGLVKHIWHILMFLVGWTSRSISYVLMWANHGTLRMGSPDIWRGEKMLPGLGVADDSARQFRKRWSNTTLVGVLHKAWCYLHRLLKHRFCPSNPMSRYWQHFEELKT